MTRSVAEAARDAVSGKDETLWQACMERADTPNRVCILLDAPEIAAASAELIIRAMSPAELKLYDISSEAEK